MHIARWRLLETKELDFGRQFVLTLYKVRLKQRSPYTDPNQGARFLAVLLLAKGCRWSSTGGDGEPNWIAFGVVEFILSR